MTTIFDDIFGRENWGERPALLGPDACTYGELLTAAETLAQILRDNGAANQVVALCVPPSANYPTALLAAWRAEATTVCINPNAAPEEKAYVLENSGATLLVTDLRPDKTESFADGAPETAWHSLRVIRLAPEEPAQVEPGDHLLVYTSGSTSRPKGVMLTANALSSNVRAITDDLALAPADRSIVFTPPAYTYAISQTLTHLWAGGAMVQWRHGMMYPAQILKLIEEHRLTGLACNPTFMRMFLQVKSAQMPDLGSVRYVKSAGQPLFPDLARRMAGLFPNARILCTYGCTENSPRICHHWLPPNLPDGDQPWSVGWPLRGVKVRVSDGKGGEAPAGSVGEIQISGSSLMRGYWRAPEINASRLVDGWFLTGDQGVIGPDGGLSVLGRADNIIGVGHEKVAPEEVEAIIAKLEIVTDVAVAGIADPLLDKVPVALVVTGSDWANVETEIRALCRQKLSAAKNPRRIIQVAQIPKTTYGKIDRKGVRALLDRITSEEPVGE